MATTKENKENEAKCGFSTLTVLEIKKYLQERGENVSGNRPELIKRAKGLKKLGRKTLSEIHRSDLSDYNQRQAQLFITPLGEELPKPWTLKGCWDENIDKIPCVRNEDLYNYLVLNRSRTFDNENMNAKRQLKAAVFYEDGHVHSVKCNQISSDCTHCYVKGRVIPSLPTDAKKRDYDVWVCLAKMSGMVHAAGCNCTAGEGESCNHVAALLYALVDISAKKKEGTNASTSKKCKWNQPRKRKLSPKQSQHITFKKLKLNGKDKDTPTKPVIPVVKNVKPLDRNVFCEKLKSCAPNAALLLSTANTSSKNSLCEENIPMLHNPPFMYSDKTDIRSTDKCEVFSEYKKSSCVTEEECKDIERMTKGQNKNFLWNKARTGRITSSVFGPVCKLKEGTKPENMIKTVMNYETFGNEATKWGNNHEAAARRIYQSRSQSCHPGLKVSESGLVICKDYPHLGSSPDGLVQCCHKCKDVLGVLEIKCPFKHRFSTVKEACMDKTFCCKYEAGKIFLKKNHSYYYQVQGQMALTNRNWCDFFIWTLKGHSVQRIVFDRTFWEEIVKKLNSFYLNCVIPEIFTDRVKRGKSLE